MAVMYPLSMKEYFETTHEGLCHLHYLGFSFFELGKLLSCPESAIKSWLLRGVEGFHPSLSFAGENDNLIFLILLTSVLGLWDTLEKEAEYNYLNSQDEMESEEYWKEFRRVIVIELGGLAPYAISPFSGGYRQGEFASIPRTFIRKTGIKIDQIVEELRSYFPQFGVTDENSLYAMFDRYSEFRLRMNSK